MNVVVYHGTTIDRKLKILEDGAIKVTDDKNMRYNDTQCGFVYVTKRICDALDFSTRPELGKNNTTFVVFRISIDEAELEHDEDEAKWHSALSDNGENVCYKIRRDLIIGKDVTTIFEKRMPSFKAVGNYMQEVQFGKKEIQESEWEKLCLD